MTKQAGLGDIIISYDDEGNELKRFLVVKGNERLAALDRTSLKLQKGDVFGKTEEELLEMTGDYVDSIEIQKEKNKVAEWHFFDESDDQ